MKYFYRTLIPFVTFDFVPTKYSTELIFSFDYDNQEPFSSHLEDISYDSCNYILNSGSMMLYLFYLVFQTLLIGILAIINKVTHNRYPKIATCQENAKRRVFWNGFFILFLQGYLEFGLSLMMAFERPLPSAFGKGFKSGEFMSYILAVASVVVIFMVVPGFAVWFVF